MFKQSPILHGIRDRPIYIKGLMIKLTRIKLTGLGCEARVVVGSVSHEELRKVVSYIILKQLL